MKSHRRLVLAIFVITSLALVGTLSAQTTRGTIAGVITDPQGAVVAGATVTATSAQGGETRTTTTGPQGDFRIEPLNPGSYTVLVSATGFAKMKIENVVVRTSQITSNNVQLAVANVTETISIEASAEAIQTETGELSKTIPQTAVQELPYASLNPYSLATTLPGVATVSSRDDLTNGQSFSVNGLRPRANNFLIDGFDNNDNGIAGQAFQPGNTEAVQEVTVKTNAYSAEFGRGGGSVSNLTFRSGGNSIHGALWETYAGSRLNALDSLDKMNGLTRPPQFVNNIFGFRLGGPVIKNKLFYFGTIQWNRYYGAQAASVLYLPTPAGIATLKSLQPNPNVDYMLQSLGSLAGGSYVGTTSVGDRAGCAVSPATGGCGVDYGLYQRTDTGPNLSREITARVDYNATNDSFLVRYTDSYNSLKPDLFANPGALPTADTQQGGPSRLFGTMWAHTFSPKVINEFRFSAQQIDFSFSPTAATEAQPFAHMPTMNLASGMNFLWGGYEGAQFPQGRGHKTLQLQDAISISKGTHTIKIGADIAILLITDQIPFNADGLITFSGGGDCSAIGLATCTALANYLDGYAGSSGTASKSFGNPRISVPTTQQAYYFQDSWKIKPNFTLDYGVRYEYQPPDASNVLAYPAVNPADLSAANYMKRVEVRPDRNNWAPRVGFSYSPFGDDKTVIRAGYGLFYDAFFTNISNNTASASPNTVGLSITGGAGRGPANPLGSLNAAGPVPNPRTTVTSVVDSLVNPMTHQWNFNVQREFPTKIQVEVAYVGTRGERLWGNQQLNGYAYPSGCINFNENTLGCTRQPRYDPSRGSIVVRSNRGDSVYHGLQTQVTRTVQNFTVRGSYTWSRSIDNVSEVFVTSGGASRWENILDPRSDRGPSAFNRTHRAAISYDYILPFKHSNAFLNAIVGGWETAGILSFQSGTPETVYIGGWDQNGDGEAFNDRPDWGNPNAPLNYSSACMAAGSGCITGVGFMDPLFGLTDWNSGASGTVDQFRYIIYPANSGHMGNVTRNNFTYPGRRDWNMSVMKSFKIRERHQIQFRADMFNWWNHKNTGVSNLNGDIWTPNFLDINQTRRGGRNISLWLKYTF